jgi:hypothetical protein
MSEKAHNNIFSDPDNCGLLYGKSKKNLIKSKSTKEETMFRKKCEFLVKSEFSSTYEEPADFSVEDSDTYVHVLPTSSDFSEDKYRVVNSIEEDECSSCNGSGVYCTECNDTGKVKCSCYDGKESKTCSNCNGSGKVEVLTNDLEERYIQCGECDGSGKKKKYHSKCNGSGNLQCNNCLGANKDVECQDCDGNGEVLAIKANKVRYMTRENSVENKSKAINECDNKYVYNPSDYSWKTTHNQEFDEIPDPSSDDDHIPSTKLLDPIPDGEIVKIRYTRKELKYEKIDVELRSSALAGSYDENTLQHTVWVNKETSKAKNQIKVDNSSLYRAIPLVIIKYAFVGLWGGSIVSLILMLPIAGFSDYIFKLPDTVLGICFFIIWTAINLFVLWDSILESAYQFRI